MWDEKKEKGKKFYFVPKEVRDRDEDEEYKETLIQEKEKKLLSLKMIICFYYCMCENFLYTPFIPC